MLLLSGFVRGSIIVPSAKKQVNVASKLEKRINHDPGLVNCGSHIIMAVRK
jgi:hypothetical protein